jgi:hypothetical protein
VAGRPRPAAEYKAPWKAAGERARGEIEAVPSLPDKKLFCDGERRGRQQAQRIGCAFGPIGSHALFFIFY